MFWRNQSKHPLRQKTPKNKKTNLEQFMEGDYYNSFITLETNALCPYESRILDGDGLICALSSELRHSLNSGLPKTVVIISGGK